MIKKEKSCGAVVYKQIGKEYFFLIEKMNLGHYSLPKGHVENGETEIQTAKREILEETNLSLSIDENFRKVITYSPFPNIIKDVVFFIAKIESGIIKNQEIEVSNIYLLSFDKAYKLLTFKSDKKVLLEAYSYLIVHNLKRICVIGCCGSGKSYLSVNLQKKSKLPLYHLDNIFWYDDWKQISKDKLRERVEKIVNKDKWIIDGTYKGTFKQRLKRADLVIYMKLNINSCLNGYLYRLNHPEIRQGIPETCIEAYDQEFVDYIKNYQQINKQIAKMLKDYHGNLLTIKSKKQRQQFNNSLKK